jgi:ribonuclease HII
MDKNILKQYHNKDNLEVGLDEAGRGCLFGPVCVAGVIWLSEDPEDSMVIKDSKKCSEKYRLKCYDYIKGNAIDYSIKMIDHQTIDKENILKCSLDGMHLCLDELSERNTFTSILVDGNHFYSYYSKEQDDFIENECIIKGDNTYKSIAAASILAKTFRDNYILELVEQYPELKKYGIEKNKGYGTKQHIEAIKKYGITQWHRTSFAPCKGSIVNQMKE